MKNKKHYPVILGFIFLIFLYFFWGFIFVLPYKVERSGNYLWGVYHVHSTMSDGLYPLNKIADEARKARVSFVLMTDHGRPNWKCSAIRKWIKGVLFIGGSESSLPDGHLNSIHYHNVPLYNLPPFPPDVIKDVVEENGITILAYPDDPVNRWKYWKKDFMPQGIEIYNPTTTYHKQTLKNLIPFLISYPFSHYEFLKLIEPPVEAISKWDLLLTRGKVSPFFAVNAHGGIHITKKITVRIPAYHNIFDIFSLGVEKKYKADPFEAIRKEDFFCIIRGAGEVQKFSFCANKGSKTYQEGSDAPLNSQLSVLVKTKRLKTRICIYKDGLLIKSINGFSATIPSVSQGVYRCEVFLLDHPLLRKDVPWIVSNPVYVYKQYPQNETEMKCKGFIKNRINLADFKIEKDSMSKASFVLKKDGGIFKYYISKYLEGEPNKWCALAMRQKMDFSGSNGIFIKALSDKKMRYYIELRSGANWFYSSFKVYPGKENDVFIPFSHFYKVMGSNSMPPIENLDSMFISINNYNCRTGFSSFLNIKKICLYE